MLSSRFFSSHYFFYLRINILIVWALISTLWTIRKKFMMFLSPTLFPFSLMLPTLIIVLKKSRIKINGLLKLLSTFGTIFSSTFISDGIKTYSKNRRIGKSNLVSSGSIYLILKNKRFSFSAILPSPNSSLSSRWEKKLSNLSKFKSKFRNC